MGQGAFGVQPAFDQPVWCGGLADAGITTAAGIFGADRDDDLEARGDDIQPFSTILADLDHVGATAWADLVVGFDHLFDARQVLWQVAKVALGRRPPGCAISIACHASISCRLGFSDSRLKVFKGQLARVRIQLLGFLAIKSVVQFGNEVILAFGLGAQALHFGLQDQKRLSHFRRNSIQIKGLRGRSKYAASYPSPPQKPIFTR